MSRAVSGASSSRLNPRFFIVAVLLAGISAALVYAKISSSDGGSGSGTAPGQLEVVVAKIAIKQRTTITPDMIQVKSLDERAVADASITRYQTPEEVVGKVTRLPIEANQQVLASAIIDTARPTGDAALNIVVPAGKRAMSIQASQVISAGGLILPGDFVDVVWTCCQDSPVISKTLLTNVQVAAVAQAIVDSGPVGEGPDGGAPVAATQGEAQPDAVTLTLLLTPEQAQDTFLAEEAGHFRADLRGPGDEGVVVPTATLLGGPDGLLPEELFAALPEGLKPAFYKRDQ